MLHAGRRCWGHLTRVEGILGLVGVPIFPGPFIAGDAVGRQWHEVRGPNWRKRLPEQCSALIVVAVADDLRTQVVAACAPAALVERHRPLDEEVGAETFAQLRAVGNHRLPEDEVGHPLQLVERVALPLVGVLQLAFALVESTLQVLQPFCGNGQRGRVGRDMVCGAARSRPVP